MAEFEKKEKYEGTWRGANVAFNRVQFGKRLTDAECAALCRDEDVEILGLRSKAGKEYGIVGHLAHLSYNGHDYIGVERIGWANSGKRGVPAKLCGHEFTKDEVAALEAGKVLHVDGLVSKAGKTFSADLSYDGAADKVNFSFGD